jgi:hypothetical protein
VEFFSLGPLLDYLLDSKWIAEGANETSSKTKQVAGKGKTDFHSAKEKKKNRLV